MDFEPATLFASLLVSSIGLVLLMYGKKMARLPHIVGGIALLVFPYFLSGALLILLVGALLSALVWLAVKNGW